MLDGRPTEVRQVKSLLQAMIATVFLSPSLWAQAPDATLDHFAPGEVVTGLLQGASCTFSDSIGAVFRSNWQKRHWIRIAGTQVEFSGESEMSDAGWYQTFETSEFTVTLRLQRILPAPQFSDGVRMTGEIVITRSGQSTQYRVTGNCAA